MRILVADDHPLYCDAVSAQLQHRLTDATVDQVSTIEDLWGLANSADVPFSLFLIDFHMPGMSATTIAELVRRFPQTPIAVISGTAQYADIRSAIAAGARGYLPKTVTGEHLVDALRLLLAGGTSVPSELLMGGDAPKRPDNTGSWLESLSEREKAVLRATARGLSNKEIGRELNLAEVTIKLHLRSIFRKIGAKSRSDAAVMASKAGL